MPTRSRPGIAVALLSSVAGLAACEAAPPNPQAALIAKGRELFFNETFAGNGRTCGTCHREEDNFTITPAFSGTVSIKLGWF